MRPTVHCTAMILTGCLALAQAALSAQLTLVDNGQAKCVILAPEPVQPPVDPRTRRPLKVDDLEQMAALELQDHLQKISGAQVAIVNLKPEGVAAALKEQMANKLVPIVIGKLAMTPTVEGIIKQRGTDPGSFLLQAEVGLVRIAGLSPEGTFYGVAELLEQLGVRWFMPGELGTVIPQTKTVTLTEQATIQVPAFHGRWHGGRGNDNWQRRMRMGGPHFPGCHGVKLPREITFENHPQYYALIAGERKDRQLCISNPEVLALAIQTAKEYFRANPEQPWIGMGPNDGGGFCECENCKALDGGDWDPFCNELSVTDRYVWFFNKILEGIKDEFPTKKVCFYVYANYMRPPVKVTPNLLICPAFAPISLCRVHGMSNPICPDKSYYRTIMEQWGKLLPDIYERGYWFNLACPGFPFSMVHRMRDEIPTAKKLGITGWRVEVIEHWASYTPSLYIAAKLMWNPEADVDALLQDFYSRFFGPAAKPMAEYFTMMDAALRDGDHHTGSSWDMPWFYPAPLRAKAKGLLDEAKGLAGQGIYAQRIAIFREAFDYLEAFIAMLEHRAACDFGAAFKDLQDVEALQAKLLAYNPPMLSQRASVSYLQRFFKPCTEQGYAKTTGGNELVAGLKDEWDFVLDSMKIGELIGYQRPELTGGNWRPIRSSSSSWSNQGLYYYKGHAWYRQSVIIPDKYRGRKLMLWFGGVDEAAKVWVNGKEVGSFRGSFKPFELDVTEAVLPGKTNVVAVKITNEDLNEMGTGGIVAPVMFYAPAP